MAINENELQLIQIGDFPETETMAGSGAEYIVIRKADGTTYRMRTSDFVEEIGISGPSSMGGVVPNTSFVPEMGSPESPSIWFATGGTPEAPVILPGFGGISLTNPLNVISWNGSAAVVKGVPIEVPVDGKIANWSPGEYATGKQVNHNGYIWSQSAIPSSTEEPGTGLDWINKTEGKDVLIVGEKPNINTSNTTLTFPTGCFIIQRGIISPLNKTIGFSASFGVSSLYVYFNRITLDIETSTTVLRENGIQILIGYLNKDTHERSYIIGGLTLDGLENSARKSVNSAYSLGGTGTFNINTTESKVILTNAYINYLGANTLLTQTVDYSGVTSQSIVILYRPDIKAVNCVSMLDLPSLNNPVILGVIRLAATVSVFINGNYSLNGSPSIPFTAERSGQIKGEISEAYSLGGTTSIVLDNSTQKIIISNAYIEAFGKKTLIASQPDVDISGISSSTILVLYNKSTNRIECQSALAPGDTATKALLGTLRRADGGFVSFINGFHSVDNKTALQFNSGYLDNILQYIPFMFGGGYKSALPVQTAPVQSSLDSLYGYYDDLVANFQEWSRTLMGNDLFGNPIYRYDFNPVQPVPAYTDVTIKNRILVTTCVHGYEKSAAFGVALFFKDMMYNLNNAPELEDIKANLKFTAIPIVTPTGYLDNTRKNRNGVDVARNFELNHVVGPDPMAENYGGPFALSEIESQYVNSVITGASDAFLGIDRHNDGSYASPGWFCTWSGSHDPTTRKFLYSYAKWANMFCQKDYPFTDQSGQGVARLFSSSDPTVEGQFFFKGLRSLILETSPSILGEIDTLERQHFETEIFGNMILAICRKFLMYR